MKLPVKIHQPFGPYLLETTCPKNILDALNEKVEQVCSDPEEMKKYCSSKGNVPNLLLRDIEVVNFTYDFLEEIGFNDFVETLGDYYIENAHGSHQIGDSFVKLAVIDPADNDPGFKFSKDILYADVWVNRYYKGDYTPLHEHGASLAGIIILKLPEEDMYEVNLKNTESEGSNGDGNGRMGGHVQFVNGGNYTFSNGEYAPPQKEGTVLIFPNWLPHLTYPLPVNSERRSLSFNLVMGSE